MNFFISFWNLQHQSFWVFYDLYILLNCFFVHFLLFICLMFSCFCSTLLLHFLYHTELFKTAISNFSLDKSQISNLQMWILKIFIQCWCHDTLGSCSLKFCGVVFLIKVPVSFGWEITSFNLARYSVAISGLYSGTCWQFSFLFCQNFCASCLVWIH